MKTSTIILSTVLALIGLSIIGGTLYLALDFTATSHTLSHINQAFAGFALFALFGLALVGLAGYCIIEDLNNPRRTWG